SYHIVDLRAAAPNGTDDISNVEFFQFADRMANTSNVLNHAPTATVANHSLQSSGWSSVATWISYSDPDGDAAAQYQFWWEASTNGPKFWIPAGYQPSNNSLTVSAADLANGNVWMGGATSAGSETIYVRASDGVDWSAWTSFTLTALPNHPPSVAINNQSLHLNQWSPLSDHNFPVTGSSVANWISYSDADGNAAVQYQFWWDASTNGTKVWTPAGYQQADNTLTVSAADVAAGNVWVGGATSAGNETIYVRASDGIDWSNWTPFTLTTAANHAPTVAVSDHTLQASQWSPLSDHNVPVDGSPVANWISYSDADGDAAVQYQFWSGDASAGAAKFWTPSG